MARKKKVLTVWNTRASAADYGIDASRGAAIIAAREKKLREEQENYDYWRQTSGLATGGAGGQNSGALATGLTLDGTHIVATNGSAPISSPTRPVTTGQTTVAAAPKATPGTANIAVPGPSGGAARGVTGAAALTSMTAEDQRKAREAIDVAKEQQANSSFMGNVFAGGTHWLSELFNYEDTYGSTGTSERVPGTSGFEGVKGQAQVGMGGDLSILGVPLGGVESVWDGALKTLGWGYDRINQVGSMGVSVLPGGIDTLSWDQAGEISAGQAAVTDSAQRTNQLEGALGGALGGALANGVNMLTGGIIGGMFGTVAALGDNEMAPFAADGFDITDKAQRTAAFEDSQVGKWMTGLTDTAISVIADPLIVGGKALKITKIRYLDRLIKTDEDVVRVGNELDNGKLLIDRNASRILDDGTAEVKAVEDMTREEVQALKIAPIAEFAHAVVRKGGMQGGKEVSLEEIFNHPVIKNAANRDALSWALHNSDTYDEAALVLKHAAGMNVQKELNAMRPDLLETVIRGERDLMNTLLRANPSLVAKETDKWGKRLDTIEQMLKRAEETDMDPVDIARLRQSYTEVFDFWQAAKNGEIPKLGTGPTATADEIGLLKRSIDKQLEHNEMFIRSLEKANGGQSEIMGVLQGSSKGFSSDTAFGRLAERSRQKRASQMTIAQTRQGQNSKLRLWTTDEFYQKGTGNVIARVLHWAGSERPSGMITTGGIGAQESTREVMALLNSIRMFSGEGKVLANGNIVGGITRKQEIINDYMRALTRGDVGGQNEARRLIDQLEETLSDEIALYHGIDPLTMKDMHYMHNGQLHKVAEEIKKDGYWLDENGAKNYAPYLETQLQTQTFIKNWRKIDELAALASKDRGFIRNADTSIAYGKQNLERLNALVQDFWRPAVLVRAGYTQRNVAEGMFRSAAFQWSLAPLGNAIKQGGLSTRNVSSRTARKLTGETRAVVAAAEKGMTLEQMPKRFRKWHENNVRMLDHEIEVNAREVAEGRGNLLRESPDYRAYHLGQLQEKATRIQDQIAELRKIDPADPRIDELRGKLLDPDTGLYGQISDIKGMTGGDLPFDQRVRELANTFDYLEDYHGAMLQTNREAMDDMISATASYRSQTLQRRRVYDGRTESTDPQTYEAIMRGKALEDPFDPNSPYANIALANLSADHTARQAVGMRSNAVAQTLEISQLRHFAPIDPSSEHYMPALARTLNQWSQSVLGKKIIDGRAAGLTDDQIIEDIVGTLFDGQTGHELRNFLNEADELHFKPEPYVGIGQRQAEALKAADAAVQPLDDEIAVLSAAIRSAHGRRMSALKKFEAEKAKRPNRVYIEFEGVDGKIHKVRGKDGLDEYIGNERLKLAKLQDARNKKHAELSKVEMPKDRINVAEPEDAAIYAQTILDRYDQLTAGSVPLQRWLAGGNIAMEKSDPAGAAKTIEMFLKATDANGKPIYELKPVLGDDVVKIGAQSAIETYRNAVQRTFRVIGAVPEDMMVRAPFYGQRYRQTAERAYRILVAQRGDDAMISMNEVNAIRELAHRRALKDTKDWLYTIDRRTAYGAVMENWLPFSSAMQNSVTTVGRIIWNDPAVAGAMAMIWHAPDHLMDPDNDGNPDTFAIPIGFVPESWRSAIGLDDYLRFNKKQFDVIGQGLFDPSVTPLMAMTTSELMKNSLGGRYTAEPPGLIKTILGDQVAEGVWQKWKDVNFGEGFGASQSWGSLDMLLAPWMKQVVDAWVRGDGSSASYARSFDNIRKTENLKAMSGYRDDFPTYEEVESKALGMHLLRAAVAFTAFTAPRYTSDIEVLVNGVKKNDQAIREWEAADPATRGPAPMPTEELYGDAAMYVAASSTRDNTSGMPASRAAVQIAEKHTDLIRDIAPALNDSGDLSLLGALAPNVENHFAFDDPTMSDPTITAYQMATSIPGAAGEQYRGLVDLAEEQYSVNVEQGWKQYIRGKAAIEAVMNQRGIWNWNSAQARPYLQMKKDLISNIASDKRFEGWYDVFNKGASGTRTNASITMLEKAAANPAYRETVKDDVVWAPGGPLDQYLANRRMVVEEMDRLGLGTLQSRKGGAYHGELSGLADEWAKSQAAIRLAYPAFATFQDRFIGDDMDPNGLGVYLEQQDTAAQAVPAEPPAYPGSETMTMPPNDGSQ